jgi:hypothetical protein
MGDLFALIQRIIANPLDKANAVFPSIRAMPFVIPGRAKREPGIHFTAPLVG